jgi:hypothetical protein
MAYKITDLRTGAQPIEETSTTKKHDLGETIEGIDPLYGEGRFIYLLGVASTAVGDAVVYAATTFQTTRAVLASRGAVAIAMSANVAGQYGWYQVLGLAPTKALTAVVAETAAQLTATDGSLDDTTTATRFVDGAVWKTADGTPAAGLALLQLSFPSANGR